MKLSWFGKLLLADYAVKAFSRAINYRNDSDAHRDEGDSNFSKVEIRAMMEAVERGNYDEFRHIYLDRCPREDNSRIVEYYNWFVDRKNNGWA